MSRLLIVEDDLQMQRALTLTLSARGFQVTAASTGAEALRILAQQRADAIVLDLGLPDMDGIEVLRAVRQDSSVPVLVLSARSDRFEKVRALDSGADDYVTKPFDLEELLARIRAAVRRATPERKALHGQSSPSETFSSGNGSGGNTQQSVGLTVRIEVNLPASGDQETYDRIFQSIRKNLLNV